MRIDVLNRFIYGFAKITVETCMVTYLIQDIWPDVNGNRLAVVEGINREMSSIIPMEIYLFVWTVATS